VSIAGPSGRPLSLWLMPRVGEATLALFVALLACDADHKPQPDAEGEFIDFIFDSTARSLCAGTITELDRFTERVFDFLGTPIPPGYHALIEVVEDAPCPFGACYYQDDRIYIDDLDAVGIRPTESLRHELVHAVAGQAWGPTVPFFAEGLAVALSQGGTMVPKIGMPVAVRDMLDDKATDLDYPAAGLFTRFLIDSRGLERFKQVYVGSQTRSLTAIESVLEDVYGESLSQIEADFLSGAQRCLFQLDVCDLERAEEIGSNWESRFAASCDDPDLYGSKGPEDTQMARQQTVAVAVAGTYRLTTDTHLYLSRCGGCDVQFRREFLTATDVELMLEPGFYTFEFVADQESVVHAELALD